MDDLISRKAAIEEFEDMVTSVSVYGESAEARYATNARIRFIEKLNNIPTVDAAPVKHGRWEDYGHCSCCGWGWSDLVYDRTEQMSRMNYCPCCGACMDLEEQHE